MSGTSTPAGVTRAGRRVRVGLGDLIAWTAGVALVVAAERRVALRDSATRSLNLGNLLGAWGVTLAVFLGIGLCRHAVVLYRGRGARGGPPIGRAIAWRLAAATLLALALAAEASRAGGKWDGLHANRVAYRSELLLYCTTLAMAGIVASLSPGRSTPRGRGWPSVLCAAAAAVVMTTSQMLITYIVMISLHAVRLAQRQPSPAQLSRPGLHDRLIRAGVDVLPVLACCLLLGVCLSHALRRPAPRPGEHRGWWAALVLPGVAAATATAAAWLVLVALPRLDEWLAEGFLGALGPFEATTALLGFSGLAFGLAARAADRPGTPDAADAVPRPTFFPIALKTALALVLLDVILARVPYLIGVDAWKWSRWFGWTDAALLEFRAVLPPWVRQVWTLVIFPERLVLIGALAWLSWRVVLLLTTPIDPGSSPIDATLGDRRAMARLVVRWAALIVLMVASLPVLLFEGLVVLHLMLLRSK